MMTSGYYFIFTVIVLIVLLLTDWKPIIAPHLSTKLTICSIVLLVIMTFVPYHIPIVGVSFVTVTAPVFLLGIIAIAILIYRIVAVKSIVNLLLSVGGITVCYTFIRHLYFVDPIYYWLSPQHDALLLAACINVLLIRNAAEQFAVATITLLLGNVWLERLNSPSTHFYLGSLEWWDEFALTILFVVVLRIVYYYFLHFKLSMQHKWSLFRKGGST
ncbi:hypothetical protein ACFSTH_04445 [Paenibacillus yanchengensis]|uniref:Uncharacterized protein n=1 Tax=Paenibacillus yanchengensis TaxID=2035833 RepID=A0ABW4YJS4_9BACL